MFQYDNAQPHVAGVNTQFLEAEHVPVLPLPVYSPDMSPIEHIWDALGRRVLPRVPVPANIQRLRTAIEEEWDSIPQATITDQLSAKEMCCAAWGK
jgi:transposase